MAEKLVKVFISYSWDSDEHKEKVLALSNSLRGYGIDCQIDRYHQAPPGGWQRWMMDQIRESDFVLVICTEKYSLRYANQEARGQGLGATWEGGLIIANLYNGQGINDKFIPVLLSPEGENYIPESLQPYTIYRLFGESYDPQIPGGFQDLYRRLTDQPETVAPNLGSPVILELRERLPQLPAIQPAPSNVSNDGTVIQSRDSNTTQRETEQLEGQRQPSAANWQAAGVVNTPLQGSGQPVLARRERTYLIGGIFAALLIVTVGSVWIFRDSEEPTVPSDPTASPEISPSTEVPRSLEQRISAGEKILVPQEEIGNENQEFQDAKRRGVQAIADQDYGQAVAAFSSAIQLYKNAPETLIYLNNARIGLNRAYTIAVAVPMGSNVDAALSILRGVAQAQDEINRNDGINGVPLRVVIVNDDDNKQTASEIAPTLASNSEILGVVGHFSSPVTLATRAIYDAQQLPSISATSTSVNLSNEAEGNTAGYGFRVVPTDAFTAKALADYMTGTLNKQQVAIFYEQGNEYSESLKKEFTLSVAQEGGEVVGEFDINDAGFNAENSVEQAIANNAQVLMLAPSSKPPSVEKAVQIIQANDGQLQLLGGDAIYISPKILQDAGAQASGMVVAVFWDIDAADENSEFPEQSAQLWGAEVNWITAMTYDATQAFINAMKQNADVSRANIQATLSNGSFLIEGASGAVRFLPNGDRSGRAQLVEIQPEPNSRFGYDFVPIP